MHSVSALHIPVTYPASAIPACFASVIIIIAFLLELCYQTWH